MSSGHAWAAPKKHHKGHKKVKHAHALVDHGASYADLVINAETGEVLHATAADSIRHPASLTKMMTLYITFQALDAGRLGLNQYLPVSENAAEQAPSKLGLRPGQRIRVEDAILGLVTESANDAAVVLAEWMGGSEEGFGAMMTRQAHALGMMHTHFNNPSGLPDPGQVTTAHDMALLGHALVYHFPHYYPYFDHDSFTYAGIAHHNHNHLKERYDGMDGIKTGYIRASGFNLVASAKRGNLRLIGVVFGGKSAIARDNHMAQLLDDAFERAHEEQRTGRVMAVRQDEAQGDNNDSEEEESTIKVGSAIRLPPRADAVFVTARPPVKPTPTPAVATVQAANDNTAAPTPVIVGATAPATHGGSMAVSAAPPADSTRYAIQIGAYSDVDVGRQSLANTINGMPQLLGTARPELQKMSNGKATIYRARILDLDAQTAQTVCTDLTSKGQACLVLSPGSY
ncbi:MAG: D-alanyl-D-alanine carboxypeptidase [Alphaproteobacteria bacterium]|nr:D-alanyl-D-alanine carboxypeptidase [Alphaproteobacteria bacterium]MBV8549377.1 D-alanyl-D-alanine carboxypeptidase [Alphaproteobacteria bacterium]